MIYWIVCLTLAAETGDLADCWRGFRDGGNSCSTARNLPVNWSPDSGIAWQRELPGYGQSSPVVWKGTVFVTAVEGPMKEHCLVVALDARSGQERWTRTFAASTTAPSDFSQARAAPTPVVDQGGLYAFFESGDLVGLSLQGDVNWRRSLTREFGAFENNHGLGGSLAQTEGAVIALVDHRGPSYLMAVDKATGKTAWKVERRSRMSWTSPIVVRFGGVEQAVVSSNGSVDGYDATTGKLLWTFDDVGGNTIASASWADGRVFIGADLSERAPHPKAIDSNLCLQLQEANGEFRCNVLWRARKAFCSYASPLPYRGHVYHVNKVGAVHCLDIATGASRYVERIDAPCWATPVAAHDHVYFFGKNGVTTVLKAGAAFEVAATNRLWDAARPPKPERYQETPPTPIERAATPPRADAPGAVNGAEVEATARRVRRAESSGGDYGDPILYGVALIEGSIFLRTGTRLYCVGGP